MGNSSAALKVGELLLAWCRDGAAALREVMVPLSLALVRPHLEHDHLVPITTTLHAHNKDVDNIEGTQ